MLVTKNKAFIRNHDKGYTILPGNTKVFMTGHTWWRLMQTSVKFMQKEKIEYRLIQMDEGS